MNIKFYDKILKIKEIKIEALDIWYLHMAEIDYLTAKMLYRDKLLFPSFLNHTQQAIEKYSCFIQKTFFQRAIIKSHNITQFDFFKYIPRDEFDIIKSLFKDFANKIRYLASKPENLKNSYAYNLIAVNHILDKFVYNVRLLLYETKITNKQKETKVIDKLKEITHIYIQEYCTDGWNIKPIFPYIIPLLYSPNIQKNQSIQKKVEIYKSLVAKENKQIELLKNIFIENKESS